MIGEHAPDALNLSARAFRDALHGRRARVADDQRVAPSARESAYRLLPGDARVELPVVEGLAVAPRLRNLHV